MKQKSIVMRILLKERFQHRKEENKKRLLFIPIVIVSINLAYSQTGALIEISGKSNRPGKKSSIA